MSLNMFAKLASVALLSIVLASAAPVDDSKLSLCALCHSTVQLAQNALKYGWVPAKLETCLFDVGVLVCDHLSNADGHRVDPQVCRGMATVYQDELIEVFARSAAKPGHVCAMLLGNGTCPDTDPKHDTTWTINIDPNKPAVMPWPVYNASTPTLQVLHISDIHHDPEYMEGTPVNCLQPVCCRSDAPPDHTKPNVTAGFWGTSTFNCEIPVRTTEYLLQQIANMHKLDHIVWTGDLAPHDIWHYTKQRHVTFFMQLKAMFEKYFPGVPVYWALGNHEGVPCDSFAPAALNVPAHMSTQWMYQLLATDLWRGMYDDNQKDSLIKSGSYVKLLQPGLKFFSVNDNYCDNDNFWLKINSTDPNGVLQWLADELLICEREGNKAHLAFHIPAGCGEQWSVQFQRIVERFENTIRMIMAGHTHKDELGVFYEGGQPTGRPIAYQLVAPSFKASLNPAYKIYTVETKDMTAVEVDGYWADLSTAGRDMAHPPRVSKLFSTKEAFGMPSLSPADYHELTMRMADDDALFQKYLAYKYRMFGEVACDAQCKHHTICDIQTTVRGSKCDLSKVNTERDMIHEMYDNIKRGVIELLPTIYDRLLKC